jgi:hypothetical protein
MTYIQELSMEQTSKLKPIQVGMTIFTSILLGAMIFGLIFFGPDGFYWALSAAQILSWPL